MTTSSSTKAPKPTEGEIDIERLQPRARGTALEERVAAELAAHEGVDGRTLRRTGRLKAFSTKMKPSTFQAIQRIAIAERISMVEAIERAIESYERDLRGRR
jgi:hypothetical protein